MCLTLANAAFVLDHVNSVRPARSFTRTLHHAGHLSPGDLWRALDGEYPRTAFLVRRHHDVITLTDQYGDSFAYPTADAVPTAVPDALESGSGERPRSPPGRTCGPVLTTLGVRENVPRPAITRAAMPGRTSVSPAPPNETGRARSSLDGAAPAPGRGGFGSRARPVHAVIVDDAGAATASAQRRIEAGCFDECGPIARNGRQESDRHSDLGEASEPRCRTEIRRTEIRRCPDRKGEASLMGDTQAMHYLVSAAATVVEPARYRTPARVAGRLDPVIAARPAAPDGADPPWPPFACLGMGDWPFFGADAESSYARARRVGLAKAICASCPAVLQCRSFALRTGQVFGIWGGLSEQELRFLRDKSAPVKHRENQCPNGS